MAGLSALTVAAQNPQKVLGEAYLKFELTPDTPAIVSMKSIQEVLALPAQRLSAMPKMPACILGLLNRRSHVLWAVDLAKLLGIGRLDSRAQQYDLILVRSGAQAIALAVHRVEGMIWLPPDEIQPPPSHAATHLVGYLRGCVLQEQQLFLALDTEAILQSSVLHQH
ncbi:chemotaxis protein CheW [Phormidesmis sp. 146-35]